MFDNFEAIAACIYVTGFVPLSALGLLWAFPTETRVRPWYQAIVAMAVLGGATGLCLLVESTVEENFPNLLEHFTSKQIEAILVFLVPTLLIGVVAYGANRRGLLFQKGLWKALPQQTRQAHLWSLLIMAGGFTFCILELNSAEEAAPRAGWYTYAFGVAALVLGICFIVAKRTLKNREKPMLCEADGVSERLCTFMLGSCVLFVAVTNVVLSVILLKGALPAWIVLVPTGILSVVVPLIFVSAIATLAEEKKSKGKGKSGNDNQEDFSRNAVNQWSYEPCESTRVETHTPSPVPMNQVQPLTNTNSDGHMDTLGARDQHEKNQR